MCQHHITRNEKDKPHRRIQVIKFGNDLMLIALGNEVVVDYSLRLKAELTKQEGPHYLGCGLLECLFRIHTQQTGTTGRWLRSKNPTMETEP